MKIEEIRKLLIRASYSYYNKSASIISDKEFDDLKEELRRLSPNDPVLKTIGSPVPKSTKWEKSKHSIPMGSLNKVNTFEEFSKWCSKIKSQYVMQEKLDGISISIEYNEGKLVKALTRNDGIEGQDITKNVIRMQNVKENLPNSFSGSLRGEIILTSENFEMINFILKNQDEDEFENQRNAASGISTNFDGKFSEYLTVLYYNVTGKYDDENSKLDYIETFLKLAVVNSYYCKTEKECEKVYNEYVDYKRENLNYVIDGMVVKVKWIEAQNKLGIKDGIPKGQIAWKFPNMQAKTKILNVVRQLGISGQITPVAILEPIKLCGVIISRASLSNYGIFKSFNFHYNDEVIIERCNDVIPGVVKNLGKGSGELINYPQICPVCNHETIIIENTVKRNGKIEIIKIERCINDNCVGKFLGNLKKWANTVFDGKGFAEKTIELLYKNGLIKMSDDFYKLKDEQLLNLEKFGKRKSEIVLDVINSGRKITLEKFIGGLNIDNFGESRAELLIENGYNTIEDFLTITLDKLVSIDGIGEIVAMTFIEGREKKRELINNLLNYVEIEEIEKVEPSSNKFEGKSFCFTGAINKIDDTGKRYTRSMMENLVVQNGGSVSSVNKNLTYLVQADVNSISSKTKKAVKLGVKILSENDFFDMVGI
jgi:DNA ligase (NAD+)